MSDRLRKPRTSVYNKHLNYEEMYTDDDLSKCKKKIKHGVLYRGYSFPDRDSFRSWFNEEIMEFIQTKGTNTEMNTKEDEVVADIKLRLNTITSWTPDKKYAYRYVFQFYQ